MENLLTFLESLTQYEDVGLFLMRLLVGGLFVYSGKNKLKDVKGFATHNGLPVPIGYLVVLGEFLGGIALVLGFYTQLAALIIGVIMLGSMYHHIFKWKSPYWAYSKGWEYDLMWFTMLLVILLTGGGSIGI